MGTVVTAGLAHIGLAIMSVLTLIAGLPAPLLAVLPSSLKTVVSIAVGLAGLALAFIHGALTLPWGALKPATSTSGKQSGRARAPLLGVLALMLAAYLLAALLLPPARLPGWLYP